MNIEKKDRTQLKNYFRSNAAPTEQNFKDFIDANLNQKEDGIAKIPDGPLAVQSATQSEELLHFYKDFKDVNPTWTLSQKTDGRSGFGISGAGTSRLFIDATNGNVGINVKSAPAAKLHLYEDTGSPATANSGSLLLEHGDAGGQSSIVFKSKSGAGADYASLSYIDNIPGGSGRVSLLTIGSTGSADDHIALIPGGGYGFVGLGTKKPESTLHIYEPTGTKASASKGTILLEHGDTGGQSSIVFKSKNNTGSDFAYIAFQDDATLGGSGEANILTISTQNDANDHIALMPSGNVGIGRTQPAITLDVRSGSMIGTAEGAADQQAVGNRGTKVRFGAMVNEYVGMDVVVKEGTAGSGNSADLLFNTWEAVTSGSREVARINGKGNMGLGVAAPAGKLHLYEATGTKASSTAGTIVLEHGNSGGESSIVFKSKVNAGSDYAYISYVDNNGGSSETSLLTISNQNDADDHIALMPSGNVGIGTKLPGSKLQIAASGGNNPFGNGLCVYNETAAASQDSIITTRVNGSSAGNPYIAFDVNSVSGWAVGIDNKDTQSLKFSAAADSLTSATKMTLQRNGNLGLGIAPAGKLHLYEATGTKPSPNAGTIVIEHGDVGGQSSIVFRSKVNAGSDYGYIAYQDDATIGGTGEAAILTIGIQNDSNDHIALMPSGNVGIGTINPLAPLHVKGTRDTITTADGDGAVGTNDAWDNGWNNGKKAALSIFAEGGIGTRSFFYQHTNLTMSDARIKEVVGRSNAQQDLARLRQVQVTDYRHIDHHTYGRKTYKKVIAQEVEEVFPEAVGQRTETIPNIFSQAVSSVYDEANRQLTVTLSKEHGLVIGDMVDLIQKDGNREPYLVEQVTATTFMVKSATDPGNVFVYGKQVDDFRFVDYNSLFMLGVSAIQALSTEMDAVKQQLKDLQNTFANKAVQVN